MKKIKCHICGREFSTKRHLVLHNITEKDYYDTYIKQPNEGLCTYCGNETNFISMWQGYKNTCGYSCAGHLREQNRSEENIKLANEKRKQTYISHYGTEHCMKSDECKQKQATTNLKRYGTANVWNSGNPIRDKLEQTMTERYGGVGYGSNKKFNLEKMAINRGDSHKRRILEVEVKHNATTQSHLVEKFGQGFLYANLVSDDMIIYDEQTGSKLIKNEFIPFIEAYTNRYKYGKTLPEQKIYDSIKEVYNNTIKCGARKPIYPKEIDIYLEDLKLGIEFNGTRWHSIEMGTTKDYHLMKSLLCQEKNIRLIHIYEFEDLDKQIKLLKQLILGEDNYPKNDFNKNNLLKIIPKPEIIYKDENYTIYGAGKLY